MERTTGTGKILDQIISRTRLQEATTQTKDGWTSAACCPPVLPRPAWSRRTSLAVAVRSTSSALADVSKLSRSCLFWNYPLIFILCPLILNSAPPHRSGTAARGRAPPPRGAWSRQRLSRSCVRTRRSVTLSRQEGSCLGTASAQVFVYSDPSLFTCFRNLIFVLGLRRWITVPLMSLKGFAWASVVELSGGGSVINGATTSSLYSFCC